MKTKFAFAAAALAAATFLSGAASAKTFVYCSEGSPDGLRPGMYTAGTTFDASAHPVYSRLMEFKPGTTEAEAGLAESYEVKRWKARNTPSSSARVSNLHHRIIHAVARLNAMTLSSRWIRQIKAATVDGTSMLPVPSWEYAAAWAPGTDQVDREG